MPVEITFSQGFPGERGLDRQLRTRARAALVACGRRLSELSVVVGDDAFITSLNAEWRGIDAPTDVLSFPQLEFPDGPNRGLPDERGAALGDIAISWETAVRQAAEQGHDLATELAILLVHGLCHLLGHDHEEPADAAVMQAEEARVLASVGIGGAGLIARAGA